jgi:hypothetical protein
MYEELSQSKRRPTETAHVPPQPEQIEVVLAVRAVETNAEDNEAEDEFAMPTSFKPNPNLPKPIKRRSRAGVRLLIAAALFAVVLGAISVTRQSGQVTIPSPGQPTAAKVARSESAVRVQLGQVSRYKAELARALKPSNASAKTVREALRSGNTSALSAAVKTDTTDEALRRVESLKTPSGLAEAREKATRGLFTRLTSISAISVASQGNGTPNSAALKNLDEAQVLIDQAFMAIDRMRRDLETELAHLQPGH